jgi:hypothetical protein
MVDKVFRYLARVNVYTTFLPLLLGDGSKFEDLRNLRNPRLGWAFVFLITGTHKWDHDWLYYIACSGDLSGIQPPRAAQPSYQFTTTHEAKPL